VNIRVVTYVGSLLCLAVVVALEGCQHGSLGPDEPGAALSRGGSSGDSRWLRGSESLSVRSTLKANVDTGEDNYNPLNVI